MDSIKNAHASDIANYELRRSNSSSSHSINENEMIADEIIETYQMYLCIRYRNIIEKRRIGVLPWYYCHRVDPIHGTTAGGKWTINSDFIQGVDCQSTIFIGVLGDSSHWIMYTICMFESKVYVYDSLDYINTSPTMQFGLNLLLSGISNFTGALVTNFQKVLPKPYIRQHDSFNCGIACLLEMERFFVGKISLKITSLNHYRHHVRRILSNPYSTMFENSSESEPLINETISSFPTSSGFLLELTTKFKTSIENHFVGVLKTPFVTQSTIDTNTTKWTLNYKCFDNTDINKSSFIGAIGNNSMYLIYHVFKNTTSGVLYDPMQYINRDAEVKKGLEVLLSGFRKVFGIPSSLKWSINIILCKPGDFSYGVNKIFDHEFPIESICSKSASSSFTERMGSITCSADDNGTNTENKWNKPVKCGYCNIQFKQQKNLKAHTISKHKGNPVFGITVEAVLNQNTLDPTQSNLPAYEEASSGGVKRKRSAEIMEKHHETKVSRSYLNFKVNEIQGFIAQLCHKKQMLKPRRDTHAEKCSKMLKDSKSIRQLLENFPWLELCYASAYHKENDMFEAIKCSNCNSVRPGCGHFSYRYTLGVNFDRKTSPGAVQHSEFRNLKERIFEHINTKTHRTVFKLPPLNEYQIDSEPEEQTSGIITKEFIDTKFAEIKKSILSLIPSKETAPISQVSECNPRNDLEIKIAESKTVEDLLTNFPLLVLYRKATADNENYSGIACSSCFTGVKSGYFKFNHSTKDENKFLRLKTNIKLHLRTKSHRQQHPEMNIETDKSLALKAKNKKIGLLLGRLAYKSIVYNQSYQSFESEITSMADAGVEVGDLNHSKDFATNLRPYFFSALKDRLQEILMTPMKSSGRPSPFTVFADKMSPIGTTVQIIGIVVMISGINKAVVLASKPVFKHTGTAIAKDIVETLNEFYPPDIAKTLLVSQSYDGQYLHLGVPEEVIAQLKIPVDTTIPEGAEENESWVTKSWDIMHLIELGTQDVEKLEKFGWVRTVQQAVVDINSLHQYGKNWNIIQECAETLAMKAVRPGSFSTTRFAAYKFRVLEKFLHMYPAIHLRLSREENPALNRINNSRFCLYLSGLVDASKVLSIMSKLVQKSSAFCWESDEAMEEGFEKLLEMRQSLKATTFDPTCLHLPKFNQAVTEMLQDGSFRNVGIYSADQIAYSTRSHANDEDVDLETNINQVRMQLATYIDLLRTTIFNRFKENHSQRGFILARELFSRDKIMERPAGVIPDSFAEYYQMAKVAHFIDDISENELNVEYSVFTDIVHTKYNTFMQEQGLFVPEAIFYSQLLESEDELNECRHIAHLLTSAMARNKSEAIAESIGSQISRHLDHRGRLKYDALNQEVFLHHNAGQYHRSCNWIVERALDSYCIDKNKELHFVRTSGKSQLKEVEHSAVIDKVHSIGPIIPPPNT